MVPQRLCLLGLAWHNSLGSQDCVTTAFGATFHDFAGSVVVHRVAGWIALVAILQLGAGKGRYRNAKLLALFSSIAETLATITISKIMTNTHLKAF